jgi:hypothetical protein
MGIGIGTRRAQATGRPVGTSVARRGGAASTVRDLAGRSSAWEGMVGRGRRWGVRKKCAPNQPQAPVRRWRLGDHVLEGRT